MSFEKEIPSGGSQAGNISQRCSLIAGEAFLALRVLLVLIILLLAGLGVVEDAMPVGGKLFCLNKNESQSSS